MDQKKFNEALYYLKMAELKKCCQYLSLPETGKKITLVSRIITFIKTGDILREPRIPAPSLAKNHPIQPLHKNALMLHGSYKNDAQTRVFFKNLIGSHFNFTAFGIDWLNDRWKKGNPPTYQEFADFWSKETLARKEKKVAPKDEWALINFMQKIKKRYPEMTKSDSLQAWKELQAQKAQLVFKMIKKYIIKS